MFYSKPRGHRSLKQIPRWKIILKASKVCDAYSIGRRFGKKGNSKFISNTVTTNKLRSKCFICIKVKCTQGSIKYRKIFTAKVKFWTKVSRVKVAKSVACKSEVGANIAHKSRDHARGKCMRSSHAHVELASYIYLTRPHHILFENISRSHVSSVYQLQFYELSLWRKLRYSLLNVRELKITLW